MNSNEEGWFLPTRGDCQDPSGTARTASRSGARGVESLGRQSVLAGAMDPWSVWDWTSTGLGDTQAPRGRQPHLLKGVLQVPGGSSHTEPEPYSSFRAHPPPLTRDPPHLCCHGTGAPPLHRPVKRHSAGITWAESKAVRSDWTRLAGTRAAQFHRNDMGV